VINWTQMIYKRVKVEGWWLADQLYKRGVPIGWGPRYPYEGMIVSVSIGGITADEAVDPHRVTVKVVTSMGVDTFSGSQLDLLELLD
jgi:hypothetical protein